MAPWPPWVSWSFGAVLMCVWGTMAIGSSTLGQPFHKTAYLQREFCLVPPWMGTPCCIPW